MSRAAMTAAELEALVPGSAVEEVGERRELVIYTGLAAGTYDEETEEWTETPTLVPMPEFLN